MLFFYVDCFVKFKRFGRNRINRLPWFKRKRCNMKSLFCLCFVAILVRTASGSVCCGIYGACFPADSQAECDISDPGSEFIPNITECGIDTCPLGACCLQNNTCENTTANGCIVLNGRWHAPGVECIPGGDCPSVPTVSEWGMVILAMSLLTLGTLVLRQDKPAPT